MGTLQVQSAGAVAPTLPASTVLSGTPTGGDSFAITLGRALENTPTSVQDGSSIAAKASPSGKEAASNSSDSPSMAGVFLTCLVTNLTQAAPTVAVSTKTAEPMGSLQSMQSTADSPPSFATSLNATEGETSASMGTIPTPAAMKGVAASGTLPAWVGKGMAPLGNAPAGSTKPAARGRGQVANQSCDLVAATAQDRSTDASVPQPASLPVSLPPVPAESTSRPLPSFNSSFNTSAGETDSYTGTVSLPAAMGSIAVPGTLSTRIGQGDGPVGTAKAESSKSTTLERGQAINQPGPSVATMRQSQSGGAATPPMSAPAWFPGLQNTSFVSPPMEGQVGETPSGSKQAQTSYQGSAQRSESRQEMPASPSFKDSRPQLDSAGPPQTPTATQSPSSEAVSYPPPTSGQTQQATPASISELSNAPATLYAAAHQELAEFSSMMGKFAGADVQVASYPAPSGAQIERAAPRSGSQAGDTFTTVTAIGHPVVAKFSSSLGKYADADSRATSTPTPSASQMGPTAPASDSEASDSSNALQVTDYPVVVGFSNPVGDYAGADVHAVSTPTPSAGQMGQAALASDSGANDSPTPLIAANQPAVAGFSSPVGDYAGADVHAVSTPTPSAGQMGQAAPASDSGVNDSPTPLIATHQSAVAGFSSPVGDYAGADFHAVSTPTPSADQMGQAAPASDSGANDAPTPLIAANQPEVAEFSSPVGDFAGADVQVASYPTSAAGQMGQAAPAFDSKAGDSSTPLYATDHPELPGFSSLLGKFAGAGTAYKVSGSESRQAPAAERSTTGSDTVTAATPGSGLRKTVADATPVPTAPKAEDLVNIPAKEALHSAQVSARVAAEGAWQKGSDPEAASGQAPLSSRTSPVPVQQFSASAQAAAPSAIPQNDAAPEAVGTQSSGAAYANSGETGAHANLTDSSTTGQGKSGQQGGTPSGDNSTSFIPIAPSIANTPAPESTTNLFAPHAPSDPVSHANTSAPPAVPPPSQPSATLSAWQNYDGGAGSLVRSAALSGSASSAEMHVELRSGALGPMEVHAVIRDGSLGAEIHVQGQEAHTLLTAGLPSLERALGERNLRMENIAVYQDQAGGGASGGGKQDAHSGSSPSPQHQVLPWDNPPLASNAASGSSQDEELANPAAGLSVQA